MNKAFKLLSGLNFKTLIFNFRYFPFKTAVKLPVLISRNVYLYKMKGRVIINAPIQTGMIKIGFGKVAVTDFKRSRAIWEIYGDVVFNGKAYLMHGCKLSVMPGAELIFGDDVLVNTECAFVVQKKVEMGNNSGISWESLVMDTDFHYIYDEAAQVINPPKEVIIGRNVWVGCRCTILKGANIPCGSIIAANSLVTKTLVGEKNIFGGNPLRVLKSQITWHY
jgi:acetyltransferase-like isoleucine patch superfamily enzyme